MESRPRGARARVPAKESGGGPGQPEGNKFRTGYAAILGRPNVGKSTLLNAFLECKLAIIAARPQSTRHRLIGVKNLPQAQIVFVDTPGIHASSKPLNVAMVRTALAAMSDADVIIVMAEAGKSNGHDEEILLDQLGRVKAPVVVALNKIDLVPKAALLPKMAHWSQRLPGAPIVPISALKLDGLDALLGEIVRRLPEGPPFFPPDQMTDQPERFFAGEIVREKIFELTGEEVPYACAVTIEEFAEVAHKGKGARDSQGRGRGSKDRAERERIDIRALIHVEKESQKAILIGKSGARLKKIGTKARQELEVFLGAKVFLGLWVKVDPNWSRDEREIRLLGYGVSHPGVGRGGQGRGPD